MSLSSAYYWAAVTALAALIAAATIVVKRDRVELPGFRVAWATYIVGWVALGAITASPLFFGSLNVMPDGWPPVWTGVPLALTVGILAAIVGGHLIAWLVGIRGFLVHPRRIAEAWRRDRPPSTKVGESRRLGDATGRLRRR